ncbi:MAG: hypothetical protein NVS9B4_15010 [Candidatus Acidiferrum sp.]
MHATHAALSAAEASVDVHQAGVVDSRTNLRTAALQAAQFIAEHGNRDIGILNRERAAEATTHFAVREGSEL